MLALILKATCEDSICCTKQAERGGSSLKTTVMSIVIAVHVYLCTVSVAGSDTQSGFCHKNDVGKGACGRSKQSVIYKHGKFISMRGECFLVYSESNEGLGKTWDESKTSCRAQGGMLVELSNTSLMNSVVGYLKSDETRTSYWIGAKRETNVESYRWLSTKEELKPQPTNSSEGRSCTTITHDEFSVDKCSSRYGFICHVSDNDFHSGTDLNFYSKAKTENEPITISCTSRALVGIKLRIRTQRGYFYRTDHEGGAGGNFTRKTDINQTVIKEQYIRMGKRCFAIYKILVTVKEGRLLSNSVVQCCTKNKNSCIRKQFSMNIVVPSESGVPRRPRVIFYFQKGDLNGYDDILATYFCEASLGDGDAMTLAIVRQNGSYWARRYRVGGETDEEGRPPSWFGQVDFERISRTKGAGGGTRIVLILTFKMKSEMEGTKLACYTVDVLNRLAKGTASETDIYSEWRNLAINRRPLLLLHRLPRISENGKIPIFACHNTINITCKSSVGDSGEIELCVSPPACKSVWRSSHPGKDTLPNWISIHSVHEFVDTITGPSTELRFGMTMSEETISSGLLCRARWKGGAERQILDYSFEILHESQPPILSHVIYGDDDPDYFMRITCSSVVDGDKQTWKLLDHNGVQHIWFVSKDGKITGSKSLPWIDLHVTNAVRNNSCGQVIDTVLKVRAQHSPKGATLTCYSYDTRSDVFSRFSKDKLYASLDIFGGGGRRRNKDDVILYWMLLLWIPVIIGITVFMGWFLLSDSRQVFYRDGTFRLYAMYEGEGVETESRATGSTRSSTTEASEDD